MAPACIAPRCREPAYARAMCRGHYARAMRARGAPPDLSPLRDEDAPARVVLSLRVTPDAKARASEDPEGARRAVERWARTDAVQPAGIGGRRGQPTRRRGF